MQNAFLESSRKFIFFRTIEHAHMKKGKIHTEVKIVQDNKRNITKEYVFKCQILGIDEK